MEQTPAHDLFGRLGDYDCSEHNQLHSVSGPTQSRDSRRGEITLGCRFIMLPLALFVSVSLAGCTYLKPKDEV